MYAPILAIALMLSNAMPVEDLPGDLKARVATLKPVGNGELRWFGLRIYSAALWNAGGEFNGYDRSLPLVLTIEYHREISSERLIRTTLEEWRRLGIADEADARRWAEALAAIWPDVAPGDRITTVVMPEGETLFFSAYALLGRIEDPVFGPALLDIWLDPRSRDTGLRQALLGARDR